MNLLKKDHKGNLKAENIPALRKYAEKSNDAEFLDGVEIIERALVMEKSCLFVAATVTDEHGKKKSLPLSMSAAD
jgi:hypothetical protein